MTVQTESLVGVDIRELWDVKLRSACRAIELKM